MMGRTLFASIGGSLLLFAACTSAPTRNYMIRPPYSYFSEAQARTAKEWMHKRGIHDEVVYGATTVSFKYGSDEMRTMSYEDFDTFVTGRLAGQTIANAQRADLVSSDSSFPATVIYYDRDGHFAQWRGIILQRGRWWIEGVPKVEKEKARRLGAIPPERVVCFQVEPNDRPAGPAGSPACSGAYDQLLGIHGKRAGDVFNLMSGKAPGALSRTFPKTWPDGQPLLPEKAPHD